MSNRPSKSSRKFTSKAVDQKIQAVKEALTLSYKFPSLAGIFENCWPNTLDTTVQFHKGLHGDELPDTFVITGDINAMWIRDSTNQVLPYFSLLPEDAKLQELVLGVILRQAKSLKSHPYSNAFRFDIDSPPSHWTTDRVHPQVPPNAAVWESKYELDSLAAFFKLSAAFFRAFDEGTSENAKRGRVLAERMCRDEEFVAAVETVLGVMVDMQMSTSEEELLGGPLYNFVRSGDVPTDTLMLGGRGPPALRCGMVRARKLATDIREAIYKYGVVQHQKHGTIFAYEVDGFGGTCLMDDANLEMHEIFEDLAKSLEGERRLRDVAIQSIYEVLNIQQDIKAQCQELDRICREIGVILSVFQSAHDDATLVQATSKARISFERFRTVIKQLSDTVPDNQFYKLNGYWSSTMQSACFLASYLIYLEFGRLLTVKEAEEILGCTVDIKSEIHVFHITVDELLQGILTLAGELSRLAGNSVILGDFEKPLKIHQFISEVYAGFQLLNLKNDILRKRFDGLKYEVKRVEEIVYDISVRGLLKNDAK
ncbi:hypothetical protein HDU67_008967 [Dinochytrium kinnereticum]|nr:hypothetical protein HDU67_008967 [Dinochytrium kinnereticum]